MLRSLSLLLVVAGTLRAGTPSWQEAACEGSYPRHVQGACSNGRDAIYWSWTDALVKTDLAGKLLKHVPADNHQGDLCHHNGKIYVAVNLGKFNQPAGKADSWVYIYDADTLAELGRQRVPELVHGAGGMACDGRRFLIVGGLPEDVNENYLYEYDLDLKFQRRHVLASGHTHLGIQTIEFDGQSWWFGCYGSPAILLRADADLKLSGRWEFNASVGLIHVGGDRFLVAKNTATKEADRSARRNSARLYFARATAEGGLALETPSTDP
jgi:hypothetical protein